MGTKVWLEQNSNEASTTVLVYRNSYFLFYRYGMSTPANIAYGGISEIKLTSTIIPLNIRTPHVCSVGNWTNLVIYHYRPTGGSYITKS